MNDFAIRSQWPILVPGIDSRSFSSFDRTGGNDDGFTGAHSALYVDERGEFVIFDAEGPGCLRTLWFASAVDGRAPLSIGHVRFYFDGEEEPRLAIEANELFASTRPPFAKPLVADSRASSGGFASWVPLPYASSLKITTEKRAFFYMAQYDTYPPDWSLETWTPGCDPRSLIEEFEEASRWQALPASGAASFEGAGVVERIAFLPKSLPTKTDLRRARIRIWWDGETQPSVDCPLGMFFGLGLGAAPLRAVAFRSDGRAFVNRFPMPFWRGYRVEVEGLEGELLLEVAPQRYSEPEAGLFCATFREERPTTLGQDYVLLETGGAGKLVGTVLAVEPPSPLDKQWWEGDLRCSTNGKRTMNIHGTGHEDDHLGGWSNEFLDSPFTLPMHGEPAVEMLDRDGQFNGNCSLYRLWPGVHFVGGISHSVEHGTENLKNFNYSSVAFWYRHDAWRLVETDSMEVVDPASRAAHKLASQNESEPILLESCFEGRGYKTHHRAYHACHLNTMEFTLKVDPRNRGVLLRRTYEQFHGRQRARVLVDGELAGIWYTPEENRFCRWAERDFFIPERQARGKTELRVALDPPAGSPLWSASSYKALCVLCGHRSV